MRKTEDVGVILKYVFRLNLHTNISKYTIPNGHNNECTQSRINTILNAYHPQRTPSRMYTIPSGHSPEWTSSL